MMRRCLQVSMTSLGNARGAFVPRKRLLLLLLLAGGGVLFVLSSPSLKINDRQDRSVSEDCTGCSAWDRARAVEALSGLQVYQQLARALSEANLRTHCRRLMQPGGKCFCSGNDGGQCEVVAAMDGKKPVCLDAGLLPEGEPCLVYSFGVRTDPSFEVEMARFGCEVHAFDPTVAKMTSLPAGVQHHLIGIDGRTWTHRTADGRDLPLMTLDDLKSALGHEGRRIDYIKLDAEGSEWNVLQHQLTAGGTALRGTPQVAIEFHLMFPHGTLSDNPSWQHQLLEEDARHQLRTLRALETAGFRLATIKSFGEFPGIGLAHAYETLWIQREGGDEGT